MAAWAEGERVLVVEHDDSTRRPKENGTVLQGTVFSASGAYVLVQFDLPGHLVAAHQAQFWAESGWEAWTGWFRWRLVKTGEEEG